jgi:maleylacetoacetate isomerase/maleylpyruvate isomerase
MKLFGYWRSTAAYRVRIALHFKGIEFENHSVHLIKNGGEQHAIDYQSINPNHLVPTLIIKVLTFPIENDSCYAKINELFS